ncbi:hypothetical protein TNCV_2338261 [Trichonephila clavipes]|nr:hypothetical protein TNCV_2338261 [Trichonephila clavipes]
MYGSSYSDLDKGDAGIYFIYPNGESYRIPTGDPERQLSTGPRYNCPYKESSCSLKNLHLQWIPANVDIFGNE